MSLALNSYKLNLSFIYILIVKDDYLLFNCFFCGIGSNLSHQSRGTSEVAHQLIQLLIYVNELRGLLGEKRLPLGEKVSLGLLGQSSTASQLLLQNQRRRE